MVSRFGGAGMLLALVLLAGCGNPDGGSQSTATAKTAASESCDREFIESFVIQNCSSLARDQLGYGRDRDGDESVGNPFGHQCRNAEFVFGLGKEASSRLMSSDFMSLRDETTGNVMESAISGGCMDIAAKVVDEQCSQNPNSCS